MNITNLLNLPEPIVEAVRNDPYDRGAAHISVTGMIGPARKRRLELDHADEITEDASQRIWALFGQVAHGILERADKSGITERRLFIERHGWTISGQFDRICLYRRALGDYKATSTYAIRDGGRAEWTPQLNIYRHMAIEHGYEIDRLEVIAILRDWSKRKAEHSPDTYPPAPVAIIEIPVWSPERCEAYIRERLIEHGRAQTTLPECSPDERWERPSVYRVVKVGNKRATAVCATESEADARLDELMGNAKPGVEYVIEITEPEQVRCADYCNAAPFCSQWKDLRPGGSLLRTLSQRKAVRAA
tara:strand:+ start:156 stop:1067 length:912 start_codon:yes stop_codon:yes gene_type:complete